MSQGLLTFSPIGGNASYIGYSHRGWTKCLTPGPGQWRGGGAHVASLAMHATAARPEHHANTTGCSVIAQAPVRLPQTDPPTHTREPEKDLSHEKEPYRRGCR